MLVIQSVVYVPAMELQGKANLSPAVSICLSQSARLQLSQTTATSSSQTWFVLFPGVDTSNCPDFLGPFSELFCHLLLLL